MSKTTTLTQPKGEAKAPRKAREKIDPNETARQRFQRIAGKRTKTALAKIKLLANLANLSAYEYTAVDVDKIEKAISDRTASAVAALRAALEKGPAKANAEDFSL